MHPYCKRLHMHAQKPLYKKQSAPKQAHTEQSDNTLDSVETFSRDDLLTQEPSAVLCGVKPVLELLETDPSRVDEVFLRKGARVEAGRILDLCRDHRIRFRLCEARDLEKLTGPGTNSQGVAARLLSTGLVDFSKLLDLAPDAPLPLVVALDQVQDPGNVGALARTLYALGGAGLVVPKHNAAFLGTGARRAAAGALERLPVSRVTNLSRALDEAEERGFFICGAAMTAESVSLYEAPLRFPMVLVLGGEENGIRLQVGKRCSLMAHIPMLRPFDSLNVAQAGAIFVAECARLRTPGK